MGHLVTTKSMQDKKGNFETKELIPYDFMLTNGDNWTACFMALGFSERDARAARAYVVSEANQRMIMNTSAGINPGTSWEMRKDVWEKFLEEDGRFSYTYPQRLHSHFSESQWFRLDELVTKDPHSRQLILSIYDQITDDYRRGGVRRVPCTMHYQVLFRENALYLIQVMRSLDLYTHLPIDMSIGWLMASHLAERYNRLCPVRFVMQIASLHAYKKDLDARGIF